jgi:hypothetical protein
VGKKYKFVHKDIEFEKFRFEYAWRHFEIYSRQILQMFNLFLITVSFLSGALVNVMNSSRQDLTQISSAVAMVGCAISMIFLIFDFRSRSLYSISRHHLEGLERNVLYPDGYREMYSIDPPNRLQGILFADRMARPLLRHKYLIPFCQIGSALFFFGLFMKINKFY